MEVMGHEHLVMGHEHLVMGYEYQVMGQCKVKSTFPARIAPFSVPLGRMEAVQGLRKARFERETWTYFALLYLHNG